MEVKDSVEEAKFVPDRYVTQATLQAKGYFFYVEIINSHYEPTQYEIENHATTTLGMSITEDRNLFYLAKEALKAKLPSNWKPCMDRNSQVWYYNVEDKRLIQ